MNLRTILLLFIALALVAPPAADAGTRLEVETWAFDEYGESERMTIYIDGNKMRIDLASGETSVIMVSDGDKTELISLENKPLEYVRLTKDQTKKFFQNVESGMEQLEQFLPQMPAEQRAQIKQQMTGGIRAWNLLKAGRDKDKEFAYKTGDSPETISGLECKQYVGSYKKDHFHDAWVAPFGKVDTSAEDIQTLLTVPDGFRGFFSMVLPIGTLRGDASGGKLGMPMRVVMYDKETGNKFVRCDVLEVHTEKIDAARFEIDKNFDEIEFDQWFQEQVGGAR